MSYSDALSARSQTPSAYRPLNSSKRGSFKQSQDRALTARNTVGGAVTERGTLNEPCLTERKRFVYDRNSVKVSNNYRSLTAGWLSSISSAQKLEIQQVKVQNEVLKVMLADVKQRSTIGQSDLQEVISSSVQKVCIF